MIYCTRRKLATESWDLRIKLDMYWNHAGAASPVNILTRYIVGVRPFAPGFSTVTLEPRFGTIRNCRSLIPLCNGNILVEYNRDSSERVTLRINSTMPVRFVRPRQAEGLQVDGKADNAELCLLPSGKHVIEYRFG